MLSNLQKQMEAQWRGREAANQQSSQESGGAQTKAINKMKHGAEFPCARDIYGLENILKSSYWLASKTWACEARILKASPRTERESDWEAAPKASTRAHQHISKIRQIRKTEKKHQPVMDSGKCFSQFIHPINQPINGETWQMDHMVLTSLGNIMLNSLSPK